MKSSSAVRSTRLFSPCWICREWSSVVSNVQGVPLCIPCYVDVLEIRQKRQEKGLRAEPEVATLGDGPHRSAVPSTAEPFRQLDFFD